MQFCPRQETARRLQLKAAALLGKLQTQIMSALQRCKWAALQCTVGRRSPAQHHCAPAGFCPIYLEKGRE